MAAARPNNGSKQDSTTNQPMQRPKVPQHHVPVPPAAAPLAASRYPTFFLNTRKQVTRPPVPSMVRRLVPTPPRHPNPPLVPTVVAGHSNGGALLISADNLRRTVYATLPSVSLHSSTTVDGNGLTNTIVSFAGKQAVTIPQSAYDLVSVVRPTVPTPPTSIYKLVNAGSAPTGRKRMPLLAPKPAPTNGVQTSEQQPVAPADAPIAPSAPNGVNGRASSVQYNNAPGWRRILRNKVIVYISPSNMVLHNYEQVKEYLLSSGTCKCGLPCPFNPEQFFQFDTQIPNKTMAPIKREVLCSHYKRATTGPERTKRLREKSTPPAKENTHQPATPSAVLLKTPPWRKNVPSSSASSSPHGTSPDTDGGPTVSPIARFSKPNDVKPSPFTLSPSGANVGDCSARDSPEQKKPTFKDDPTGYLNQQTAILHNSISFLHSPDRRSPLPSIGGLSPKPADNGPVGKPLTPSPKEGGGLVRRQRTPNRPTPILPATAEPQAKITSLTGVVKYEAKSPIVTSKSPASSASSIKVTRTLNAIKSPHPLARLTATSERSRLAYYVKANAAPGVEQCSSAKVAKLSISTVAGETVIPCPIASTTTSTTTTTIARTNAIMTPTSTATTAAPMFVPTRSSHVINAGGAQIVVIDGLQHSAVGSGADGSLAGKMRIGAFPPMPARHQPLASLVPTVSKPTVVNYSLSRTVNGTAATVPVPVPVSALSSSPMPTTTSGAMILNGTNIIHLSNGLSPSTFHGGLLTTEPSSPAGPNHCLPHPASPKQTSITIPNGALGLVTGSTVVLNPTTSIRFADNTSFTTPGGFSTATVASNTYHYSPAACTNVPGADTLGIDITGGRKVKRQLKSVNGTPLGTAGGLVLPASSPVATLSQPQPATFQQQLQPGPFVQIASPYGGLQNIQLASSLPGLTVVPVSKSAPTIVQQQPHHHHHHHHHQQQPYGLLGQTQTILLSAGSMVMASDANSATTTLLQIQNMSPHGNAPLLAGQTGLVLRQPKPPSTAGFLSTLGQQSYLIGGNASSTATTRPPTSVNQRPLAATITTSTTPGGTTALFGTGGTGGGLSIVTATQPLPVPNLTMQQPQQITLTPIATATKRPEPLKPDARTAHSQPESTREGANEKSMVTSDDSTGSAELKPNTAYQQEKKNCVSVSQTEPVPGIAITLKGPIHAISAVEQQKKLWQGAAKQQQQQQQHGGGVPLAESPNRTGRIAPPPSTTIRTGNIGFMRRGPAVQVTSKQQPEHRVKLSVAVPSTPTEGSTTCLLTDVLPEQSYDVTTALNDNPTASKSRNTKRLRRNQSDTEDTAVRPVEPFKGPRQFRVGDLVWGAVRGFPAWPGKVVPSPPAASTDASHNEDDELKADEASGVSAPDTTNSPQQVHVWVRWFGTGRASAERVEAETLQSLSEGLEIHHRAQKDARKSRKLNAQLEQAIQQAMQELDHAAPVRGKQRQHRRYQRRPPPPPGKRHRTVGGGGGGGNSGGSGSVNANMCNRKGGSVRYLRGNKFKAKS